MTDARIVRTRSALHKAITSLASDKPVGDVTVSELADLAGINRVTFYKHYSNPAEALADALATMLAEACSEIDLQGYDPFAECVHAVLDSLEQHRPLYTIAFSDPVDGTIPMMLSRHLNEVAFAYLTKRRKRKPPVPDIDLDVAAAYLANGVTGAIRVWILEGDMTQERFFENLPLLVPSWFFSEPSEGDAE